jgi:hypothetical protein
LLAAAVYAHVPVARAAAGVAAILVIGAVASDWTSASNRSTPDRVPNEGGVALTAGKTVAANGVRLTVPAGWESESFVNASGMSVFRLGSFKFRHAADDDVGQTAQASMGPTDVLINIVDVTATDPGEGNSYYRPVGLPLTMDSSPAVQQQGYTAPAAVIRGVRINGHNLSLSVAFGTPSGSGALVAAADARTLAVP